MFDATKVGEEIFGTLRSFDYAVAIFDEEGNKVYEPAEARRFFTDKKNITVSLFEDGENSAVHVYLGRSVDLQSVQGMLDTLRRCATKFGILYNVRQYRRELKPKDFANGGTVLEGRKLTGSTKSSYLKLEGACMILRHDTAIDDKKQGARGRNVRKVMIENRDGERFLMPTQNLMAGRAMTRHISKGGQFHDEIGTKITEMASQQQHMKTCASYCRRNKKKLDEDVADIAEACTSRAKHLREMFEGLYRRYDKTRKIMEKGDNLLLETDDEMLEEKLGSLRKKLQLEDESVMDRPACESVIRVLGESNLLEGRPKKVELIDLPALDCKVEKHAWEAFKADEPKINFLNDTAPALGPCGKNYSACLSLISNQCADDAFANMLAKIAQSIEYGKVDQLIKAIAHRAVHAANNHPKKGEEQPLVRTPSKDRETIPESKFESLRKLDEWADSFSEERIFEDDWGSRHPNDNPSDDEYDRGLSQSLKDVEDGFNVDDFLVMSGDDFHYGDTTMSVEDKVIEASDLLTSLKRYLNSEIESEFSAYVEVNHDEFGDLTELAQRLLPQVTSRLEQEGYTVNGMDALENDEDGLSLDADDAINFDDRILDEMDLIGELDEYRIPDLAARAQSRNPYRNHNDEGIPEPKKKGKDEDVEDDGLDDDKEFLLGGEEDDLSSEDVLLPVNPEDDFKRDVAADGEDKQDDEDDTSYINRILSLAHVKGANAPRGAQP